jgi:hypothetical protein
MGTATVSSDDSSRQPQQLLLLLLLLRRLWVRRLEHRRHPRGVRPSFQHSV